MSLSKCPPSVAEALEATDIMIALEATDTKKSRTNFPSIRDTFICLIRVYKKNRVCTKKTSSLRPARLRQSGELAKRQKAEFTNVNEHFCCKRNEKIGVFLQTLITKRKYSSQPCGFSGGSRGKYSAPAAWFRRPAFAFLSALIQH